MNTTIKTKTLWKRPTTVYSFYQAEKDKVPFMEIAIKDEKAAKIWSTALLEIADAKVTKSDNKAEKRPFCYMVNEDQLLKFLTATLGIAESEYTVSKKTVKAKAPAKAKKTAQTRR